MCERRVWSGDGVELGGYRVGRVCVRGGCGVEMVWSRKV